MTIIDYLVRDVTGVVLELARVRAENDTLREVIKEREAEIATLRAELQKKDQQNV